MPIIEGFLARKDLSRNLTSKDYGRLLGEYGLAVLQEDYKKEDRQGRIPRASELLEESVRYNPRLAESWINLAFIAVFKGDCGRAIEYAARSAEVATGDKERKMATEMSRDWEERKRAGDCASYALDLPTGTFHPDRPG